MTYLAVTVASPVSLNGPGVVGVDVVDANDGIVAGTDVYFQASGDTVVYLPNTSSYEPDSTDDEWAFVAGEPFSTGSNVPWVSTEEFEGDPPGYYDFIHPSGRNVPLVDRATYSNNIWHDDDSIKRLDALTPQTPNAFDQLNYIAMRYLPTEVRAAYDRALQRID